MPAPGQFVTGSLAARIHRFLIDYHDPQGFTPKRVSSMLQPPEGFDVTKWHQTVSNQLAREARNGTLVKDTADGEVRYRRANPAMTENERRGAARSRLRNIGVSITTEREYSPETWDAAAGVFIAATPED